MVTLASNVRDRSKITLHNLFSKVLKTLDILQTECDRNVFLFQATCFFNANEKHLTNGKHLTNF